MNLPEQRCRQQRANRLGSTLRHAVQFFAHQLIGSYVVGFFAAFVTLSSFEIVRFLYPGVPMSVAYRLLTGTPYYPIQIAAALSIGWSLNRRLQHPSVRWVWVLPCCILLFFLTTTIPLRHQWTSVLVPNNSPVSRLSYYFGHGCLAFNGCIDQIVLTMPFYVSVAYSVSGAVALRGRRTQSKVPHT